MLGNLGDYHVWTGTQIRKPLEQLTDEEFSRDLGSHSAKSITQHIVLALETCFLIATKSSDESVFTKALKATKNQLLFRWKELDRQLAQTLRQNPKGQITVPHIAAEPFDVNAVDFYLQYIFHTTHHRGQLAIVLRKLGKDVPGTDYLMYLAQNGKHD